MCEDHYTDFERNVGPIGRAYPERCPEAVNSRISGNTFTSNLHQIVESHELARLRR